MIPEKLAAALKEYAKYSLDELKAMKSLELRQIAPKLGISKLERSNGEEVVARAARKEELAIAIFNLCKDSRVSQSVADNVVGDDEAIDYSNSEDELKAIAKKYYFGKFDENSNTWLLVGLNEANVRMQINQAEGLSAIVSLSVTLKNELEALVKERSHSGELNINSLHNWRSRVLKEIEKFVNQDKEKSPNLGQSYKLLYDCVQSAFKVFRKERVEETNIKLNTRQSNAIDIKVGQLVSWAKDRLVNLPEDKAKWQEVAIALMILTGRRQSEIMSSAKFTPTDSDNYLEFSGQLKKHKAEENKVFEIPVLGQSAQAVIDGINWLEKWGKRDLPIDETYKSQQEAAKKAHDRLSRYLSSCAKDVCEKYIVLGNGAEWLYDSDKLDKKGNPIKIDRRKCHLFRQIYGQVVIRVFYSKVDGTGKKPKQILSEVMGHSDSPSSRKYAAENYDSDVDVKDIDALKAICGRV